MDHPAADWVPRPPYGQGQDRRSIVQLRHGLAKNSPVFRHAGRLVRVHLLATSQHPGPGLPNFKSTEPFYTSRYEYIAGDSDPKPEVMALPHTKPRASVSLVVSRLASSTTNSSPDMLFNVQHDKPIRRQTRPQRPLNCPAIIWDDEDSCGQLPIEEFPVPGRRCPDCFRKGQTVWVLPGKKCSQCGTIVK
nr:hypothetical protein CFP56_10039 [Quercus suber]